jgi:hypothetical protein
MVWVAPAQHPHMQCDACMVGEALEHVAGQRRAVLVAIGAQAPIVPIAWVCGNATVPDKMTVKGPKPRDAVMPFLREGNVTARLTALGYFYATGKASDAGLLAPFEADRTLIPRTDDPEGKWQCDVTKADGKETETKDVKDVGDFVRFCVLPAVKTR